MSILAKEVFTFIEVARWRSVRKAAERLNISASALSRQLRILEEDLGVKLVTRYSHGVQVTEAGERFLLSAKRLVALESGLRGEIGVAAGSSQLQVRLGLAESISMELSRRLRAQYMNDGDDVRLDVVVGETDRLLALLAEGHLDAVVAFNLPTDERYRIVEDFEVQVGLVCNRELISNPPKAIALADCLGWPLCLPNAELSILPRLMSEIQRQGRSYTIAATSNSIATTCGLIVDGVGVGFMTLPDVIAQREAGKLIFVPLKDRRLTENISFAVAAQIGFRSEIGASLQPISRILSEITTGPTVGDHGSDVSL